MLKRFLSRYYKTVEISHTLKDGLVLAEKMKPDFLFLDNNLPDGTGIEHIKFFRDFSAKIIMISAMTNLEEHALKTGADFFIGKPISFPAIQKALS